MPMRPKLVVTATLLVVVLATSALGVPGVAADDRFTVVRAGQTLSGIAAAHGTTVERLMRLNHLADPNRIYAGQRLRLRPAAHRRSAHPPVERRVIGHRVTYGETVSGIALRYHLRVDQLVRRNHLADASRIYVGQLLRIRAVPVHRRRAPQHAAGHASFVTHIVRFAETLSGIALHYRVSVGAIVAANGITNPSLIRVGQQLRVPSKHRAHHRRQGHAHQHRRHAAHRAAPTWRMPSEMAALVRQRSAVGRAIRHEARRQGVPPALAKAVAWQESGWQPRIVSSAGAIGVMQLLPATADWVSATMLGEPVNLWSTTSNVRAGVALLRHYLHRYDGSRTLALAAYYQGQAGTDRYGVYPVSRPYIDSILILEQMFRR
ncbi:MAG TPA: LysM peptidoglycan-binding domain-containing protein [Candidatus Limnocylindria bacterium]